jgi:uncharacterized membrane protein
MIRHLLKHLRTKIFTGILVVLPLGITFLVLKFVFNILDNILGPLMPEISVHLLNHEFLLPGLGILGFFLLLYLFGVITSNVLGHKLVGLGDRIFKAIPVVKNIYTSSKQLTDAFSATRAGAFRQAVFVEFPLEDSFTLGFITNEIRDFNNQEKVAVFVPTAMVPPMGFLLFLPKEKVLPSNLTIEEAIKSIMSVGIVTPPNLSVPLSRPLSAPLPDGKTIENSKEMKYLNSKSEGGS